MTTSNSGEPDKWDAEHQEMLPGDTKAYPTSRDCLFRAQTLELGSKAQALSLPLSLPCA